MAEPTTDPLRLLAEWYEWWDTTDDAPAKMPNALHVRTVMVLALAGLVDEAAHIADPRLESQIVFPPCSFCGATHEFSFRDLLSWCWQGFRHWRAWSRTQSGRN